MHALALTSPRGRKGVEKKITACPAGLGLELGAYYVLGKSPQLRATQAVYM